MGTWVGARVARTTRLRKLQLVAIALVLVLFGVTAARSRANAPPGWAAGLPGCDTSRPAVAHHADQQVLAQQPADGPIPCGMLTAWPTVETRVEVTNDNVVIQEPAILSGGPVAGGSGHMYGWGGRGQGLARTLNEGRTWDAVSVQLNPDIVIQEGGVDNNLYVDHDTNRLFFYMMGAGGPATYGHGAKCIIPNGNPATVAFTDDKGTTWNWGFDMDHGCAENPTVVTGKPIVSTELAYPNIVYLCGDNTSSGYGGAGTSGWSCSKSLTGGRSWLGTTLQGQGYYSGIAKDTLAPYPECGGQSSSAGAAVQPLPDGTLVVVMTCNNKTFLSASSDEGATWKVLHAIPQGGTLRADSKGNLFVLRTSNTSSGFPPGSATSGPPALYLSHSTDGGATWSPERNMVAPGVTSVGTVMFAQGTHAPGQVGHVAATYYAKLGSNTTSDGIITETRDALNDNPVFWSGQVNRPSRPLLYNTPGVNMGITVLDFLGGALSMDGRSVWGAWVQDCGDNLVTDVRCRNRLPAQNPANPQDGFAGRLVWPPSN